MICCDDPASWASRLESFGAEHVVIGTMEALAPEGQLERAAHDCDAVIIDSWRRWLRAADRKQGGRSNSANDESVVGPVIDRLVDLAHSPRGPAVTMLANEAKSAEATTARGSFALEDAVDFVRRISKEGDVTTISTADKVRVGIPTGPWRMRLVEPGGFEPSTGGGGSSLGGDPFQPFGRLDEEITGYLMAHPHSTARAVTRHVRHRFAVVRHGSARSRSADRIRHGERVPRLFLGRGTRPDTLCPKALPTPIPIARTHPDTLCPKALPTLPPLLGNTRTHLRLTRGRAGRSLPATTRKVLMRRNTSRRVRRASAMAPTPSGDRATVARSSTLAPPSRLVRRRSQPSSPSFLPWRTRHTQPHHDLCSSAAWTESNRSS